MVRDSHAVFNGWLAVTLVRVLPLVLRTFIIFPLRFASKNFPRLRPLPSDAGPCDSAPYVGSGVHIVASA